MRRLELIVEASGDRKTADARYVSEVEAFAAQTNFVSLLTSAARGIGVGETSRATQRLAFALSIPWMSDAYDDVVAAAQAQVPVTIALAIDDWSGSTTSGSNESELVQSVQDHVSAQERAEIALLGGLKFWWPSIVAALLLGASYYGGRGVLVFAALFLAAQAVLYALRAPKIAAIRKRYAQQRADRASTVRSFCAEVVDLREEIVREDAVSGEVRGRLQSIRAHDYLGSANATGRTVLV
jgi:hypothetical protein